MNEDEIDKNEVNVYEAPNIFELGRTDELTTGPVDGDWPDALHNRFMFAP